MAFLPAILPYVAAAGAVVQGVQNSNASRYNAQVEQNQQTFSINQANAQEGMVRRASRQALGKQEAAFGSAGVGYGGSSETSLDQSAINQELDALNTRYKGSITGYGYGVQAGLDRQNANQQSLTAGAALLKGIGSNYSFSPSASPGTTSGFAQPTAGYS
jgi:hypothetical protein